MSSTFHGPRFTVNVPLRQGSPLRVGRGVLVSSHVPGPPVGGLVSIPSIRVPAAGGQAPFQFHSTGRTVGGILLQTIQNDAFQISRNFLVSSVGGGLRRGFDMSLVQRVKSSDPPSLRGKHMTGRIELGVRQLGESEPLAQNLCRAALATPTATCASPLKSH